MSRNGKFVKAGLFVLTGILILFALVFVKYKTYNFSLNTLTEIKYFEPTDKKYAYRSLTLTPTVYYGCPPFSQTVIAKAIYKDRYIGIKITATMDKLTFKSIGDESDNFVQALCELYEEQVDNVKMRAAIESDFLMGGGIWNCQRGEYKASITALNGKNAELYLTIDIPNNSILLGDKNRGLSKKRFVNAFIDK